MGGNMNYSSSFLKGLPQISKVAMMVFQNVKSDLTPSFTFPQSYPWHVNKIK